MTAKTMLHGQPYRKSIDQATLLAVVIALSSSAIADAGRFSAPGRRRAVGLATGAEQGKKELSEEERAQGFIPLFNGRDLAGWEHNGRPGTFVVKDGLLVGRRRRGSAYWLSTKEQYGDFELRLQYKIEQGGNSGIFIRAPRQGRTSREGMEIQIYDQRPRPDKPHKGSTGAIYGVVAPRCFAERPPGEWNDLRILCEGNLVRLTLNAKPIVEVDMSKYAELRNRPRRCYICLSAHTKTVWFRNIRIRLINQPDERGK